MRPDYSKLYRSLYLLFLATHDDIKETKKNQVEKKVIANTTFNEIVPSK